jgi:hypothetical protein
MASIRPLALAPGARAPLAARAPRAPRPDRSRLRGRSPRVVVVHARGVRDGDVRDEQGSTTVAASARRHLASLPVALALALAPPWAVPPPADAKLVNVTIDPASLSSRLCDDPRAGGVPGTATFKANCMEIVGVAVNPSGETVYNADVYGSVKDGANDDVLNSGRVGSIAELKPGENAFRLKLVVGASQPLPLKLKAFKAQGVTQKLNASPNPYDDYTEFDDFGAQK